MINLRIEHADLGNGTTQTEFHYDCKTVRDLADLLMDNGYEPETWETILGALAIGHTEVRFGGGAGGLNVIHLPNLKSDEEKPKGVYVCEKCGNDHPQITCWVDANNKSVLDEYDGDAYCGNCGDEVGMCLIFPDGSCGHHANCTSAGRAAYLARKGN